MFARFAAMQSNEKKQGDRKTAHRDCDVVFGKGGFAMYQRLINNLNTLMNDHHITQEEMADIMGSCRQTFRRRMENPGNFTLEELRAICFYFGIKIQKLL